MVPDGMFLIKEGEEGVLIGKEEEGGAEVNLF